MKLLTKELREKMLANGQTNRAHMLRDGDTEDFHPVVKLFVPWGSATWLLTELDPEDPDIAFGLCDLGHGSPELGSVRISELEAIRGPAPFDSLHIERDLYFKADRPLTNYADVARSEGRIVA